MKRQRVVVAADGCIRFKANPYVRFLYDEAAAGRVCSLNELIRKGHEEKWPRSELRQLYRLMGYSVSGYGDVFPRDSKLTEYDAAAEALGDSGAWPPGESEVISPAPRLPSFPARRDVREGALLAVHRDGTVSEARAPLVIDTTEAPPPRYRPKDPADIGMIDIIAWEHPPLPGPYDPNA